MSRHRRCGTTSGEGSSPPTPCVGSAPLRAGDRPSSRVRADAAGRRPLARRHPGRAGGRQQRGVEGHRPPAPRPTRRRDRQLQHSRELLAAALLCRFDHPLDECKIMNAEIGASRGLTVWCPDQWFARDIVSWSWGCYRTYVRIDLGHVRRGARRVRGVVAGRARQRDRESRTRSRELDARRLAVRAAAEFTQTPALDGHSRPRRTCGRRPTSPPRCARRGSPGAAVPRLPALGEAL